MMSKRLRFLPLLLLLVSLAGCTPEPNDDYNPTEGAPTHEKMFDELFGVKKDHNTLVEIFTYSKPPLLLGVGLDIIWFMATIAFIIIIVVGGIKSTLQAPTSQSLLGNDISTPLAPVRIGLTAFFLLTLGSGHYSVIESIVLSANKYVSAQANKLYTTQVENYRDEYIALPSLDNNPGVKVGYSQNDYYKMFRTAMCMQYIEKKDLSKYADDQAILEQEDLSGQNAGTFMYAAGIRYNIELKNSWYSWGRSPIDGGCGQWYLYTEPPTGIKIGTTIAGMEIGWPDGDLNKKISQEIQGAVASSYMNVKFAWNEFKALSYKMIQHKESGESVDNCGTHDGAIATCDQYFSNEFYRIVNKYNERINNVVNLHYNSVLSSPYIGEINDDAIDTARNHGWFFAGALPYMFASSAERLNVFENITLNTSTPQPDAFPKAHQKELKEYFAYTEQVMGLSGNLNNSALLPRDHIGATFGGTYISCLSLNFRSVLDCVGAGVSMETLSLTRTLAMGISHPLTASHRVGKSGANATLNAMIGLNMLQAGALTGTATLVGPIPFWGSSLFSAFSTVIQTTVTSVMPFLEYLNISYVVLGFFVVLMPFVYFSIAIVSYIITLFVSVLAANFFAVSHAWLEGQGVVSSYAQRGYPSLIFSALTPLLVVLVFFIYLYTMPFIFMLLGYAYNLFLTPFMKNSLPGVYGGMFFFMMLIVLIIAIHRAWARLLLTIPDRVMRLIGVHEALTQNDFSGEVDRGGQEGAGVLGRSTTAVSGAAGTMIAGNAGGRHQSVIGGGSDDLGGASAHEGHSGERDTSGYSSASETRSGGQYRANPRNSGLGHMAASYVAAKMMNQSSGGPAEQSQPSEADDSGEQGNAQQVNNENTPVNRVDESHDVSLRKEADASDEIETEDSGTDSDIASDDVNTVNSEDGSDGDTDDGGDIINEDEQRENDLRNQISTDNEKTSVHQDVSENLRESDLENPHGDGYGNNDNKNIDESSEGVIDDEYSDDE